MHHHRTHPVLGAENGLSGSEAIYTIVPRHGTLASTSSRVPADLERKRPRERCTTTEAMSLGRQTSVDTRQYSTARPPVDEHTTFMGDRPTTPATTTAAERDDRRAAQALHH